MGSSLDTDLDKLFPNLNKHPLLCSKTAHLPDLRTVPSNLSKHPVTNYSILPAYYVLLAKRSLLSTFALISVCVAQHTSPWWAAPSTAIPWAHTPPSPVWQRLKLSPPAGPREWLTRRRQGPSLPCHQCVQHRWISSHSLRVCKERTEPGSPDFPAAPSLPADLPAHSTRGWTNPAAAQLMVTSQSLIVVTFWSLTVSGTTAHLWSMVPKRARGSGEQKPRNSAPLCHSSMPNATTWLILDDKTSAVIAFM